MYYTSLVSRGLNDIHQFKHRNRRKISYGRPIVKSERCEAPKDDMICGSLCIYKIYPRGSLYIYIYIFMYILYITLIYLHLTSISRSFDLDTWSWSRVRLSADPLSCNDPGQVVHTHVPLSPSRRWCSVAVKITIGLVSHWPCVTDSVVHLPTGSVA